MMLLKNLGLSESNFFSELVINFKHCAHSGLALLICLTNHFFIISAKVNFNTMKSVVIYIKLKQMQI